MEGVREYWLYELRRGQGVYQGCTGPGAEGVVRRVVEAVRPEKGEDPGEPFKVYCFEGSPNKMEMLEADHAAAQAAGFHDTGEVLSAYNTLVLKHDWLAERLKQAEAMLREVSARAHAGSNMNNLLGSIDNFLGEQETPEWTPEQRKVADEALKALRDVGGKQ